MKKRIVPLATAKMNSQCNNNNKMVVSRISQECRTVLKSTPAQLKGHWGQCACCRLGKEKLSMAKHDQCPSKLAAHWERRNSQWRNTTSVQVSLLQTVRGETLNGETRPASVWLNNKAVRRLWPTQRGSCSLLSVAVWFYIDSDC